METQSKITLKGDELITRMTQVQKEWKIVKNHHIEKEYTFKNFMDALAFTNQIGALAEKEGHHPNIELGWGKVKIILWTHSIDGLSEKDFILAKKIDLLS